MGMSKLLDSLQPEADGWTLQVDDSWTQGRTLFGGLQAAILVRAAQQRLPSPLPLRVLQLSFVAPLPPGAVRVQARVLRAGRAAVQIAAELLTTDGQTACSAVLIFGAARSSAVTLTAVPALQATRRDPPLPLASIPGLMPTFLQHFMVRWDSLGLPFSGEAQTCTEASISYLGTDRLDIAQLVALADVLPSPAMSHFTTPTMASSMTWMLQILDDDCDFSPDAPWRLRIAMRAAADGYVAVAAELFSPAGRIAALGQQTAVVFG